MPTFPGKALLKTSDGNKEEREKEVAQNYRKLNDTFDNFNVQARVVDHVRAPMVTRYDVELGPGVALSKLTRLASDMALALAVESVLIEPVPGRPHMGVQVPNATRDMVTLGDVFSRQRKPLEFTLGTDIDGGICTVNLAKAPHLLVGGATGSGKSVFINVALTDLIMRNSPADLRLVLIDPKQVELTPYQGLPHLWREIITDPIDASNVLGELVDEMEYRYGLLNEYGYRKDEEYNGAIAKGVIDAEPMCKIVIVIDEMSDLMMVAKDIVEKAIIRIGQKARAAGIHMILATQRPAASIITNAIKANVPSRIAFAVPDHSTSRVILSESGAEKLLGMGDGLVALNGARSTVRFQGAFVSDDELNSVIDCWSDIQRTLETLESRETGSIEIGEPFQVETEETETDTDLPPLVSPTGWVGQKNKRKDTEQTDYISIAKTAIIGIGRLVIAVCYISVALTISMVMALIGSRSMDGSQWFSLHNRSGMGSLFGTNGAGQNRNNPPQE